MWTGTPEAFAILECQSVVCNLWDEDSGSLLGGSGLPLKPAHEIAPYSPGITVLRPDAIGNYKLLDGRFNLGMTAAIVEIARQDPTMEMTLMCLYLQPHAKIVLDAVDAIRGAWGESFNVTTIAEAVGSDVTNVLSNAMREQNFGAAITAVIDAADSTTAVRWNPGAGDNEIVAQRKENASFVVGWLIAKAAP